MNSTNCFNKEEVEFLWMSAGRKKIPCLEVMFNAHRWISNARIYICSGKDARTTKENADTRWCWSQTIKEFASKWSKCLLSRVICPPCWDFFCQHTHKGVKRMLKLMKNYPQTMINMPQGLVQNAHSSDLDVWKYRKVACTIILFWQNAQISP